MAASQKSTKMKNANPILLAGGLFLLLASLAAGVYLVSQRTSFFGRAADPTLLLPSIIESHVFASPTIVNADGKERSKVTVIVLNGRKKEVFNQDVSLVEREGMQIYPIQPKTDDLGVALFEVSATKPGDYLIEAVMDGKLIEQRARVSFVGKESDISAGIRTYFSNFLSLLFGKR